MLSAEEAFEASKKKLEENTQTIDELLVLDNRIKESIEKGYFATFSEPMSIMKAEKLSCEIEEYGYASGVQASGMVNAETKEQLVVVTVNWKFKPPINSRIKQPDSI